MLNNVSEADIRLLRIFVKVVEAGGFSAAQIELNVGQSTISTHMASLEERLGMRLCQRGRGGFSLTEKGRLIYQASKRMFGAIEAFRSEAGALKNHLVGELAIGIVDNVVNNPSSPLHEAISAFNGRAPEVQISVHVAAPTEIERSVLDGRFHLGLGACGRHSPYLSYEDLFEERQILYCGRGHRLFAADEVLPEALADCRFVRRSYSSPNKFPAGLHMTSTAEADLMESVALFILSGRHIGYLPQHYAQPWVDRGEMRPLLEAQFGYRNPIYLTTHKTAKRSLILTAFLHELQAVKRKPKEGRDGASDLPRRQSLPSRADRAAAVVRSSRGRTARSRPAAR
jgi:DNA-binding transcriptional LysR family regulator